MDGVCILAIWRFYDGTADWQRAGRATSGAVGTPVRWTGNRRNGRIIASAYATRRRSARLRLRARGGRGAAAEGRRHRRQPRADPRLRRSAPTTQGVQLRRLPRAEPHQLHRGRPVPPAPAARPRRRGAARPRRCLLAPPPAPHRRLPAGRRAARCSTRRPWSRRGDVHGLVPKTYIPGYKEYYEERWFASSRDLGEPRGARRRPHRVPVGTDLLFRRASMSGPRHRRRDLRGPLGPAAAQLVPGAPRRAPRSPTCRRRTNSSARPTTGARSSRSSRPAASAATSTRRAASANRRRTWSSAATRWSPRTA